MAALATTALLDTGKYPTELAGDHRLFVMRVTPTTASDTITLTTATHGISTIVSVRAQIISGQGANFAGAYPSVSGLVITLATLNASGANATTWGNVDLWIIGK